MKTRSCSLLLAVLAAGCSSELPPAPPPGNGISGRVFYAGSLDTRAPGQALVISAFATFPPSGPPHGLLQVSAPDFTAAGLPYALSFLPEYGYFVLAEIVDLNDPSASFSGEAAGGYPNTCKLGADGARVAVSADHVATGIDLTIYDEGGAQDPCHHPSAPPPTPVPTPALAVTLTSSDLHPGSDDLVSIAVFTSDPPAGAPAAATMAMATGFPQTLTLDSVPATRAFVSACFRKASDSFLCNSPGDVLVTAPDPVTISAGHTAAVTIDLE